MRSLCNKLYNVWKKGLCHHPIYLVRNLMTPRQLLRNSWREVKCLNLFGMYFCNSACPCMPVFLRHLMTRRISNTLLYFFQRRPRNIPNVIYLHLPLFRRPFCMGVLSSPFELLLIKADNSRVPSTCSLMAVL